MIYSNEFLLLLFSKQLFNSVKLSDFPNWFSLRQRFWAPLLIIHEAWEIVIPSFSSFPLRNSHPLPNPFRPPTQIPKRLYFTTELRCVSQRSWLHFLRQFFNKAVRRLYWISYFLFFFFLGWRKCSIRIRQCQTQNIINLVTKYSLDRWGVRRAFHVSAMGLGLRLRDPCFVQFICCALLAETLKLCFIQTA